MTESGGPQDNKDYQSLIDSALRKEKKGRRTAIALYALPVLLIAFGASYSGIRMASVEEDYATKLKQKQGLEEDIKDLNEELTRTSAELASTTAHLDSAYDFAEKLPQAQRESFDATIRASESPSKDAQAFVVIFSLPTLARARASAKRFTAETRQEVEIYRTPKGLYAVTLGPATTPDEARKRLDQAKTALGKSDAYIRYSVDWIRQPG